MSLDPQLALRGEFSIYRAAEQRQQLLDWLQPLPAGSRAVLDLAGVTEMDSAGAQLLVAARHTARQRGLDLHCARPSAAVQDVLQLLALHDLVPPPQP